MTMEPPRVPLNLFPTYNRPWNNITPLTYRDGLTYLQVLEQLRKWIREELVKHIDDEMKAILDEWERVFVELTLNLTNILEEYRDDWEEKQEEFQAEFDRWNDQWDEWLNNQIVANGELVALILAQGDSPARVVLDGVYGSAIESVDERVTNLRQVDASMFGVVGDGITDDTDAFADFIEYVTSTENNAVLGTFSGTVRITSPIVLQDIRPGTVISGARGSELLCEFTEQRNAITAIQPERLTLEDFTIRFANREFSSHGISVGGGTDCLIRNVDVHNYQNTGIIFYKNQHPESARNRIESCRVFGYGEANNGIAHATSVNSSIINCESYGVSNTGAPGYALQLKNDCVGCVISGGIVDGGVAGVAFGYDDDAVGNSVNCIVTGVTVSNCNNGALLSRTQFSRVVDLHVNIAQGEGLRTAVRSAGLASNNVYKFSVTGVTDETKVLWCQERYNYAVIESVDALRGGELVDFRSTSQNNTVEVYAVGDKSALTLTNSQVTDSGTSNMLSFRNTRYAHATTGGSVISFTTPGSNGQYIQYSHTFNQFIMRASGTDALRVSATAVSPGQDRGQSLGAEGQRFTEAHIRDAIHMFSPDGQSHTISVNNAGQLVVS